MRTLKTTITSMIEATDWRSSLKIKKLKEEYVAALQGPFSYAIYIKFTLQQNKKVPNKGWHALAALDQQTEEKNEKLVELCNRILEGGGSELGAELVELRGYGNKDAIDVMEYQNAK